jgi:carbon-monoxide dehydrogenase small subunit
MTGPIELTFTVNGRPRTLRVAPHHTLLDVLRDDVGLTGTKECCLVGECGACTVMVNGRSIDSCLALAAEFDRAGITTVEGLAVDGELSPLQRAFLDTGAAQCGFCIPGQLMAAHALLATTPQPTRAEIEEGLAGNLCRCAGYGQIIEAVMLAASGATAPADAGTNGPALARADPASTPESTRRRCSRKMAVALSRRRKPDDAVFPQRAKSIANYAGPRLAFLEASRAANQIPRPLEIGAGLVQLRHEVFERAGARRPLAFERLHRVGGHVVGDAAMPVAHEPPHEIGPHPAQPDHAELHRPVSRHVPLPSP